MYTLSNFLFVCLCIYIFIYSITHFIKNGFIILNFRTLFTLGFVYYLIVPYYYLIFKNDKTVISLFNGVYEYAEKVSEFNYCLYMISIFILYFCTMLFSKYHVTSFNKYKNENGNVFKLNYKFFYIVFFVLCLFFTYKFRTFFGKGYTEDSNMTGEKGAFLTASIILYILSFHCISPKTKCFSLYGLVYFVFALIIMTMGGRLYFLTTFLSIIVFYANYNRKIRIRHFIFAIIIVGLIFSAIGVIRQGNKITSKLLLFIFLGEPILTSYSLFSCLSMNNIPILQFPYEFLFGIINLVPSFVLPNKVELINKFADLAKFNFVAPVGAENVFTSLMVNFGILGIPLFVFCLSMFLRKIKSINQDLYYFAISWFVFTFYRDPFYVSLWKILFEFVFLIPVCLYIYNYFMFWCLKK